MLQGQLDAFCGYKYNGSFEEVDLGYFDPSLALLSEKVFQWPGIPYADGVGTRLSCGGMWMVGFSNMGGDTFLHAVLIDTTTGGFTDLGSLGGNNSFSFAFDVSCDGSVVVGTSYLDNGLEHAFLWTEANGMVDLGSPSGPGGLSRAFGVSADGSVVVGDEADDPMFPSATHPFIWTADSGFQVLGSTFGSAFAVTADGSTVVGQARRQGQGGHTAFLWTQAGGMQDLGSLPGFSNSVATAISDDGQVVVGFAASRPISYNNAGGFDYDIYCLPFVWTAATGMQDLNQVLANAGVDTTGYTFYAITGISADGKSVCGGARTPQGDPNFPFYNSGFFVQLPQ
jgi:probable HAF family extracellular repeat protein